MPPHLRPGLSTEGATRICMEQCRAQCCRGPLILHLAGEEASQLEAQARALGVAAAIARTPDGTGWIRFSDHAGEHCPFLDSNTSACLIYASRPQRCRSFPERPTPGCAISGGA